MRKRQDRQLRGQNCPSNLLFVFFLGGGGRHRGAILKAFFSLVGAKPRTGMFLFPCFGPLGARHEEAFLKSDSVRTVRPFCLCFWEGRDRHDTGNSEPRMFFVLADANSQFWSQRCSFFCWCEGHNPIFVLSLARDPSSWVRNGGCRSVPGTPVRKPVFLALMFSLILSRPHHSRHRHTCPVSTEDWNPRNAEIRFLGKSRERRAGHCGHEVPAKIPRPSRTKKQREHMHLPPPCQPKPH